MILLSSKPSKPDGAVTLPASAIDEENDDVWQQAGTAYGSVAGGLTVENSDIIFMLARQRSGTNALRSVLNRHPDVFCIPEIFNTAPTPNYRLEVDTNYFAFVERYLNRSPVREILALEDPAPLFSQYLEYLRCFSDKRYILVDVKYNSAHHVKPAWRFIGEEPALFALLREQRVRVLNLTRTNYLRYYLSEQKAQATRRWHAFDPRVVGDTPWYIHRHAGADEQVPHSDVRIRLDVGNLLTTLGLCRGENQAVAASFADYDLYLSLEYADLFPVAGGPLSESALALITNWLGVMADAVERRPEHRKQSDLPLWRTIENWPEVVQALQGTEFATLLEDEPMYTGEPATHFDDC